MNKILHLESAEDLEEAIEHGNYNNCEFKIKANIKASYFKCVADEEQPEDKLELLVLKCAIKSNHNYEMMSFVITLQNLSLLNLFPDSTMEGTLKTLKQNSDKSYIITFYLKKSKANFYKIIKNLEISTSRLNIDDNDYNESLKGTDFLTSKFTTEATVLNFYHSYDKHRKWRCVFEIHNEELGNQKFTVWEKSVLKTIAQGENDFILEINDKFKNKRLKFSISKVEWVKKKDSQNSSSKEGNKGEASKVYYNISEIFEV